MASPVLLRRGVAERILDTSEPAPVTGWQASLPVDMGGEGLAWQTKFGTPPTAVQVDLEATVNGTDWKTIDSSTNVNGDTRIVIVGGLSAVRARLVSKTGGDWVNVFVRVR